MTQIEKENYRIIKLLNMKQNKMLKIIILVMCLLILKVESRTLKHLKVKLTHGGTLIGRYMISFKGNGIRAFLGIPYAKPPVNELRFKVK